MKVNIKNKKNNHAEISIIKLNDISPSFINISRKESIDINIYYIDHFYLDDDDIELKMLMDILKKIMVDNILILIILIIIKRFCKDICFYGMILKI